jgi:hypothetical protein
MPEPDSALEEPHDSPARGYTTRRARRTEGDGMERLWEVASWLLVGASAVLAVLVGAPQRGWGSASPMFSIACAPCFVVIVIYVVREAIRSEPGRETPMGRPIDYIRRWSSLIAERLLTPVMTGLLLSTALVSVIALATHVIVG